MPSTYLDSEGEEAKENSAIEVESDLILPIYTDTEIMMDDVSLYNVDFMSRFEKFKVDERRFVCWFERTETHGRRKHSGMGEKKGRIQSRH